MYEKKQCPPMPRDYKKIAVVADPLMTYRYCGVYSSKMHYTQDAVVRHPTMELYCVARQGMHAGRMMSIGTRRGAWLPIDFTDHEQLSRDITKFNTVKYRIPDGSELPQYILEEEYRLETPLYQQILDKMNLKR